MNKLDERAWCWSGNWLTGAHRKEEIDRPISGWEALTSGGFIKISAGAPLFTISIKDLDEGIECKRSRFLQIQS